MNPKSTIALTRTRNLLVVGLCATFASSALAAQLSSRFVGALATGPTLATVPVGSTVTVEVMWTQNANEAGIGLTGLGFALTAVPENPAPGLQGDKVEDPDLLMSNVSATLPGWANGSILGTVGGSSQFAIAANLATGSLATPGTTVVGTFEITVAATASMGLHPFYILRNPSQLSPDVMGSGGFFYSYSSPSTALGTYDIGGGFAGSNVDVMRSDDSIPLMINVVPEPATLTLLAMGGFAVLRRRNVARQ